jgi:hypothetical protein
MCPPTEHQAAYSKPATAACISHLRPYHLLGPPGTDAGHSPAHLCPDLHQQLSGRHRCCHLGRRRDQSRLCCWPIPTAARTCPGSAAGTQGLFGRAVAVVGTPSRRAGKLPTCVYPGSVLTDSADLRPSTAPHCILPPLCIRRRPCPRDTHPRTTACGTEVPHWLQYPRQSCSSSWRRTSTRSRRS